MDLNSKQAAFLLYNFPALMEQIELRRENILEGCRQSAVAGGRKGSGHSDPTIKKALLLIEDSEMVKTLSLVRQWIDEELPPVARPLLLSVWRVGKYGWSWVAKDQDEGVKACRDGWESLVENMLSFLITRRLFAGTVSAPAGDASADGPKSYCPE